MHSAQQWLPPQATVPLVGYFEYVSSNFPTLSLRHQGFRLTLSAKAGPLEDFVFLTRPPLNGAPGYVSLTPSNYPSRFVRMRPTTAAEVYTDAPDGSPNFAAQASWRVLPGMTGAPGSLTLENGAAAGCFLRHSSFLLVVAPFDGSDLFRADSSFTPRPAPPTLLPAHGPAELELVSLNYPTRRVRHQGFRVKLHERDGIPLDFVFHVVPALTGAPDQVSLRSANFPDRYVRVRPATAELFIDADDDSPLSANFAAQASWRVAPGLADPAAFSFESALAAGYFARHSGFLLCIAAPDGSGLFRADATFAAVGAGSGRLAEIVWRGRQSGDPASVQ